MGFPFKKVRYKAQLKDELKEAKKTYKTALFNYQNVSIKDENWEEVLQMRNEAYINYQTAQSRLDKLDRPSIREEIVTTTSENNKNQKI